MKVQDFVVCLARSANKKDHRSYFWGQDLEDESIYYVIMKGERWQNHCQLAPSQRQVKPRELPTLLLYCCCCRHEGRPTHPCANIALPMEMSNNKTKHNILQDYQRLIKEWFFLWDNAPVLTTNTVQTWMAANKTQLLALSNYFLFHRVKEELAGVGSTPDSIKKIWEGVIQNIDIAVTFRH